MTEPIKPDDPPALAAPLLLRPFTGVAADRLTKNGFAPHHDECEHSDRGEECPLNECPTGRTYFEVPQTAEELGRIAAIIDPLGDGALAKEPDVSRVHKTWCPSSDGLDVPSGVGACECNSSPQPPAPAVEGEVVAHARWVGEDATGHLEITRVAEPAPEQAGEGDSRSAFEKWWDANCATDMPTSVPEYFARKAWNVGYAAASAQWAKEREELTRRIAYEENLRAVLQKMFEERTDELAAEREKVAGLQGEIRMLGVVVVKYAPLLPFDDAISSAIRLAQMHAQCPPAIDARKPGQCLSVKYMHWGSTINCVRASRHTEPKHTNGHWEWLTGDEGEVHLATGTQEGKKNHDCCTCGCCTYLCNELITHETLDPERCRNAKPCSDHPKS